MVDFKKALGRYEDHTWYFALAGDKPRIWQDIRHRMETKKAGPWLTLPRVAEKDYYLTLPEPPPGSQAHEAGAEKQQGGGQRNGSADETMLISVTVYPCARNYPQVIDA